MDAVARVRREPVNRVIRAALPAEAEAVLETLCAAFDLNVDAARPIFLGDPFYDLSHKRVLALPELGIVSCLTVVPSPISLGAVLVPACGVAGVATRPEYQRRGYAAALLEATVPNLWNELGYPLAFLHPISAPFYRVHGWEYASQSVHWTATPSSLPRCSKSASVRPATGYDWPVIQSLHDELTRAETGSSRRDWRRWGLIALPIPGREAVVVEDTDGGLSGYAIWERRESLSLLEMHGRTPESRATLVGCLAQQPEAKLEWQTSPVLLGAFGLPLAAHSPEPDAMLRIVHLPAALAAVHAALYAPVLTESNASLTLRATDTLIPANALPLRLTRDAIVPGSVRDASWLRADIRILAQLYLGYRTPSEASSCGLITCDSPETLALADQLFPARAPFIAPLDQV